MRTTEMKDLQSYRRLGTWGTANPQIIPPAEGDPAGWSPLTTQLHALAGIAANISDAAIQQELHGGARLLGATSEDVLRAHLRAELHAITQVAQALRKEVPGIGEIRMPRPRIAMERLLTSAEAITNKATIYQAVLLEHGLAPDFLAQVQQATAALKASVDGRSAATVNLKGATKRLATGVTLGRKYVKLMDAALTKTLRNDPVKLEEWKTAKRVGGTDTTATASDTAASMLAGASQTSPALGSQAAEVKVA